MYSLLGFEAIAFFASVVFFVQRRSFSGLALAYIAASAGLLTHYHFGILLVITSVMILIYLARYRSLRVLIAYA